jgi:hypothetical protein
MGALFADPLGSLLCHLGRALVGSLLPLLLAGCALAGPVGALGPGRAALGRAVPVPAGYQASGTIGFRLLDTPVEEQLYRPADGSERALLWSAAFVSRWPVTADQLERWSAQAVGLLADGLGPGVQLAGWERLDATDIGERQVAYRYRLRTTSGDSAGEATIVVFSRGEAVGLTGAAAMGSRAPIDALGLARGLETYPEGS